MLSRNWQCLFFSYNKDFLLSHVFTPQTEWSLSTFALFLNEQSRKILSHMHDNHLLCCHWAVSVVLMQQHFSISNKKKMFQWKADSKHSYCQAQWCHFVTSVLFHMNKQQLRYTFSLMTGALYSQIHTHSMYCFPASSRTDTHTYLNCNCSHTWKGRSSHSLVHLLCASQTLYCE